MTFSDAAWGSPSSVRQGRRPAGRRRVAAPLAKARGSLRCSPGRAAPQGKLAPRSRSAADPSRLRCSALAPDCARTLRAPGLAAAVAVLDEGHAAKSQVGASPLVACHHGRCSGVGGPAGDAHLRCREAQDLKVGRGAAPWSKLALRSGLEGRASQGSPRAARAAAAERRRPARPRPSRAVLGAQLSSTAKHNRELPEPAAHAGPKTRATEQGPTP